jgi:hypothetical protein
MKILKNFPGFQYLARFPFLLRACEKMLGKVFWKKFRVLRCDNFYSQLPRPSNALALFSKNLLRQ